MGRRLCSFAVSSNCRMPRRRDISSCTSYAPILQYQQLQRSQLVCVAGGGVWGLRPTLLFWQALGSVQGIQGAVLHNMMAQQLYSAMFLPQITCSCDSIATGRETVALIERKAASKLGVASENRCTLLGSLLIDAWNARGGNLFCYWSCPDRNCPLMWVRALGGASGFCSPTLGGHSRAITLTVAVGITSFPVVPVCVAFI